MTGPRDTTELKEPATMIRKTDWLIAAWTIAVFALDWWTPRGWSVPLLYLPSILAAYRLTDRIAPFLLAGLCSSLTIVGFLISAPDIPWPMAAFNRVASLVLLWLTALFVVRTKRAAEDRTRMAEAIERQKTELQTILDALPMLIFYKDREHRIVRVNEAHARSLGLPKEQIEGRTDAELGSPYASQYIQDDQQIMTTGVPIRNVVEPIYTSTGTRWLQTDKIPMRNALGEICGLIGLATDVTELKQTEEKLYENERNLAHAQRLAGLGSWSLELAELHEINRNPLRWSDEVFRIFGYEPGQIEVSNENFFKAVHPDDRSRIQVAVDLAIRNRRRYSLDHRICLPDGTERIVHEESDITFDEATGRPIRMVGTIQDITEQKRAEEELRRSEERYRILLQRIPDPMFVYDRETLGYLAVNDAAIARYGYSREEFLHMTVKDIRPPEELPALLQKLANTGTEFENRGIWRHRTRDGKLLDVEITAHALDLSGRPACIVLAHDVTDRSRAEAEVRKTTSLLRAVAEGTPDAVFVKDLAGRYLLFNPAAARFVGLPIEEVLGRDDTALFGPDDAALVMDRDRRVAASGQIETEEEELTAAGVTRTYLATKAPYRDAEGNIIGVFGISRDITERKQAEQRVAEALHFNRTMLEASPIGIITYRGTGEAVSANEAASRIVGGTTDQLKAQNFRQLESWRRSGMLAAAEATLQTGTEQSLDVDVVTTFGKDVSLSCRFAQFQYEGRPHLLALLVDITARRRVEERLKQTADRLGVLLTTSQALSSTLNLDQLLEQLLNRLAEVVPATDFGAIYIYDRQAEALVPRASAGVEWESFRQIRLHMGESISGRVLQSGQSVLSRTPHDLDIDRGPERPETQRLFAQARFGRQIISNICVPLRSPMGEIIGTIALGSTHAAFNEDDLSLLEGVAGQAAVAIENANLFDEVRIGRQRLQMLSRQLIATQEAERRHIARELHDEIGQVLTVVGFHLHSLIDLCGEEHKARLEEDISLVDRTIQQVRDLSLDLRPPTLDVLGLEPTLRAYLEDQARRTGLVVHISGHLESRLPPEVEVTCYRLVQATLTNVVRHAQARQVWVELHQYEHELQVIIRDDGIGFDVPLVWQRAMRRGSFGLMGVQERVELIGGRLTVESAKGHGTTIGARFPLATGDGVGTTDKE